MRDYFAFDGTPSTKYNAFLASGNTFDAPERDVENITVPGRNGDLLIDNGRFLNFTNTITMYIPSEFAHNAAALRNWLKSKTGYCRYEDTLHPLEYRMAHYVQQFEVQSSDRHGGYLELSFDCKPQRFLTSGEIRKEISSGAVLYNATMFDALPLIEVTGSGTITIGNNTYTCGASMIIDSEAQDCYDSSGSNLNSEFTAADDGFPVLEPGANGIVYTGFTEVAITPRWWMI